MKFFLKQKNKKQKQEKRKGITEDMNVQGNEYIMLMLKEQCGGDFVVFWLKMLKYFTKNLVCNMKLRFQHPEENILLQQYTAKYN